MPSIRVIAGAAIGCLFVCALFGCQGLAQTASTEPVGKPMQLPSLCIRPDVPVIMITAYGDLETKRKALENGAEALLKRLSHR
jgi:CheY-like chemotaxis protein